MTIHLITWENKYLWNDVCLLRSINMCRQESNTILTVCFKNISFCFCFALFNLYIFFFWNSERLNNIKLNFSTLIYLYTSQWELGKTNYVKQNMFHHKPSMIEMPFSFYLCDCMITLLLFLYWENLYYFTTDVFFRLKYEFYILWSIES